MPSEKLILTCDSDETELTCSGGYINNERDEAIVVYFCPKCENYYISINGSFLEGSWILIEPPEAEDIQVQLRNGNGSGSGKNTDKDK